MRMRLLTSAALCGAGLLLAGFTGCSPAPFTVTVVPTPAPATLAAPAASVVAVEAGDGAPKRGQAAMINAKPGDVIELGEGRFDFNSTLSLDVSHVTVRGKGPTRRSSASRTRGGHRRRGAARHQQGRCHPRKTSPSKTPGVTGSRSNGTKRIVFRNIRAEWTGGPKETNGGYGIYPVLCTDVLIEDCKVVGRLRRRHLCRPVGEHRRPAQHGREKRRRHRDRKLDPGRRLRQPGHRQLRRHPGLHDARPADEGRPPLPRLQQQGAGQQPR